MCACVPPTERVALAARAISGAAPISLNNLKCFFIEHLSLWLGAASQAQPGQESVAHECTAKRTRGWPDGRRRFYLVRHAVSIIPSGVSAAPIGDPKRDKESAKPWNLEVGRLEREKLVFISLRRRRRYGRPDHTKIATVWFFSCGEQRARMDNE